MPIRCANCGEELLGAVNRCWRCGTNVPARSGVPDLPPQCATPAIEPAESDPVIAGDHGRRMVSSDSRSPAAAAAAVTALALGVLALVCCPFTVGAVPIALVGLPLGAFGLFSVRRGCAVTGMLLCCIALAIGGFQAVVWWYQLRGGMSPWQAPAEF
jgi:hypothetical protein